ncbi:argonaute/piwi family protein [Rhizobium ruizarguesonis]|uniref:argonaute/piwi family protein n=1 Tax=Rhizobium ruizarguesonis TaxID=2081791 RepID=UPI0010324DC7|nr:Piwi domain-containing protein [Rhizobium ruizarguesonis]TBE31668.1 hypothetical protein ELH07_02640 [Rhizobium ruizarguesonis]
MPSLTINFAPLNVVGKTTVQIGRQAFDPDRLRNLRIDFSNTHVFRRDGKADAIVDIPIADDAAPIGNVREQIDLRHEHQLWPELFRASLLRAFNGRRPILSAYPVSLVGAANQGLLVHPDLPNWLERRSVLKFDTRRIELDGRSVTGVVCESRLKSFINATCDVLVASDIPLVGRYVQIQEPSSDDRVLPRRRVVGRVREVNGRMLVLDDNMEGFDQVPTNEVYLEPRSETVDDCVLKLLGGRAAGFLAATAAKAQAFNSGPGRKTRIEEAMAFLRDKANLSPVPGASFKIADLIRSKQRLFPSTELLDKPLLVFDPSGSRRSDWPERSLRDHGPYDQRTFTSKRPRIAVICQARLEGQVDAFIAKFLDGMPDVKTGPRGRQTARYGDGFLRRFALDKASVGFFLADGSSADAYFAASKKALDKANDEGFKWDLAIVQVEEEFKSIDDGSNPYYATKSVFLKRDIPVQSVRLETMSQAGSELVFSMNHMSLATYAKLGGVPWLLASRQTTAHELVIGLGSHTTTTGRTGPQQRYVGITTVFSSDGSYLLSDRTGVVPYERYADELYETLKRTVDTVRKQDNWRATDKVRLVFHMFKPLKDLEVEAIERTIQDLDLKDVTFAFLHIAPDHPLLIFDEDQPGVGFGNNKKGVLGPFRRLNVRLSDFESLIVFSGASELKQASDGMPRPALLKLHRRSTFKDMTYLARQAFEFSGHSWRMLAPEPYPITIRYSDLIAERLTGLANVAGWDDEAIKFGNVGRRLWFL